MRAVWSKWQIKEGGELVKVTGPHPWYVKACYGWRIMRQAELQRFPLCRQCQRVAATMVDHVIPFITPEGIVSWALFSDPANHRALCRPCHSRLTAKYDSGFGNKSKAGKETHCQPTGETGKQFSSASNTAAIDKALNFDVADLLAGIPD